MRPRYPRSDFAADPGLVPDTENHKTPHPDAATAPRTADTGASDPVNAATGLGGSSAVDSYIATLLQPGRGLAAKTGRFPVQFQNPVGGMPLSGGQVFLRNLVGGYNARAGFDPNDPKQAGALARLLQIKNASERSDIYGRNVDSLIANRTARTDIAQNNADPTKIGSLAWMRVRGLDPDQVGSPAWNREVMASIAKQNAQTNAGGKAETARHNKVTEGQGSTRIGISQKREARLTKVTDAYLKLPPGLQSVVNLQKDALDAKLKAGEITPDEYGAGMDELQGQVLWQSQFGATHNAMNPYAGVETPKQTNAPQFTGVETGASTQGVYDAQIRKSGSRAKALQNIQTSRKLSPQQKAEAAAAVDGIYPR